MNLRTCVTAGLLMATCLGCAGAQSASALRSASSDEPSNGVIELAATPGLAWEHRMASDHDIYKPWLGVINISLRSVSRGMAHLETSSWAQDYRFEVVDSDGRPVPLTDFGKQVASLSDTTRALLHNQNITLQGPSKG